MTRAQLEAFLTDDLTLSLTMEALLTEQFEKKSKELGDIACRVIAQKAKTKQIQYALEQVVKNEHLFSMPAEEMM